MTKPSTNALLVILFLQFLAADFLDAQSFRKHPSEAEFFYEKSNGERTGLSYPYAIQMHDRLMWIVGNEDGYGLVNRKGEVILETNYDYIGSFKNDLAIVIDEGYFGVIDTMASFVLDLFHDVIYSIERDSIYLKMDGIWMVHTNNQYLPIDSSMFGYLKTDQPVRLQGCNDMSYENCRNFYQSRAAKGQEYPKYARKHGYEGSVIVELTIDEMGSIIKKEVIQSVGGGCDEEALRCINQNVPYWIPAIKDGKPTQSSVKLLFAFRLVDLNH